MPSTQEVAEAFLQGKEAGKEVGMNTERRQVLKFMREQGVPLLAEMVERGYHWRKPGSLDQLDNKDPKNG